MYAALCIFLAGLGFVRQGQSHEVTINRKIVSAIRPDALLGCVSAGLSAWFWL
jgi:hypothetical protein